MIDAKYTIEFNRYLETGTESQIEKQLSVLSETFLSEKLIEILKNLRSSIKIIAFAEIYCPDCQIIVPYLEKMAKASHRFEYSVIKRQGSEDYLKKISGNTKIPTFILIDKNAEKNKIMIEFPKKIKDKIELSKSNLQDQIIEEYRAGKYRAEIDEELCDLLSIN